MGVSQAGRRYGDAVAVDLPKLSPDEFLSAAPVLERAFRERVMHAHVELLGELCAALRGALAGRKPARPRWTREHATELMARLQLPPCEAVYRVRPFGAACTACGPMRQAVYTAGTWPGGSKSACRCGEAWLTLDESAQRKSPPP